MTMNQLATQQIALERMHLLANFSREAGFVPHMSHARYIYAC